ncbi:AAA family ATPase [Neorhizobium alkalisoli]|uniref:AAA domain-containing protein n=1 Tax=Neorhizobium alkalisoli TaxID=528178 RepID=A0A561QSQ0_9HYPH|nr:AAA family ATPase [Neorhizobium alkalisoli]TWF53316.1 AAA domain-containing protein [Neorhizobium alkalisoli]
MANNFATIDWDDFDEGSTVFQSISAHLTAHSAQKSTRHKYWRMPGWIGAGDLTAIFGPSEAGKSVFSVDLACRLAAGWDFGTIRDRPSYNILYIAAERGDQVRRRVDAFVKHHGGEPFGNLMIYDGPIDLCEEHFLRAVIRTASQSFPDEYGAEVVIIDTLAAAMSASDSNPEAMHKAVNSLTDAVRHGNPEAHCSVIVVHHSPVSGEARMRGAGQLQGAADMTIHVTRKRGVSVAKVAKNNEGPDRPIRTYRMETVSLGRAAADEPETTAPVLIEAQQTATENDKSKPLRRHREAVDVLRGAIAANDNKPVTEELWRAAVYLAAGNISEGGKRLKFSRHKEIIEAGFAVEDAGLFQLS